MSKFLKFCTGIEILTDFHSIMSVCRHELGGRVQPNPLSNSNPAHPTFSIVVPEIFIYFFAATREIPLRLVVNDVEKLALQCYLRSSMLLTMCQCCNYI